MCIQKRELRDAGVHTYASSSARRSLRGPSARTAHLGVAVCRLMLVSKRGFVSSASVKGGTPDSALLTRLT